MMTRRATLSLALGGGIALAVALTWRSWPKSSDPAGADVRPAAAATAAGGSAIDLGRLSLGEIRRGRVVVENPSTQPLVLLDVRTSCPCLQVLDLPALVPPSGQVEVTFRYLGTAPGRAEHTLTVVTEDSRTTREFRLRAETTARRLANLPDPAGLEPRLFRRPAWQVGVPEGGVSVETLRTRLGQPGTVVLDVREPAAFVQGHLPGSLNVPRRQVRTKGFLRAQSVVLIDDGLHDYEPRSLRTELQAEGFARVEYLEGGLNAWRRAGGQLEGALEDLAHGNGHRRWLVPPSAVQGTALETGLVLVVDEAAAAAAEFFFPHARLVRFSPQAPEQVRSAVRAALGEARGPQRLLVVGADGAHYGAVETSPWGELPCLPFYLEGGLAAYEKHLLRVTVDQRNYAASRINPNAGRLILSSGEKAPSGADNLLRSPVPCPTCPGSR